MPDLDPATKEVWAGLREPATRRSEIAEEVADLRAELTGYDAYDPWVQDRSDYDDYESELLTRYDEIGETSDSDISRTRQHLEDDISSWSDYQTGVGDQDTWDEYRTYLTDEGLDGVDADRHIQLLQLTFDPGQTFKDDSDDWSSFGDFETYLEDNGFSSDEAGNFRDKVEQRFDDFDDFDSTVLEDDTPLQKLLAYAEQLTEVGDPNADTALKLWDVASKLIDGTDVPGGGVSIRGEDVFDETGDASGLDTESDGDISYSNFSVSKTEIAVGEEITVSVEVTNETSRLLTDITIPLIVNSEVVERKTTLLVANQTAAISFDWTGEAAGLYTIAIGSSSAEIVRVNLF